MATGMSPVLHIRIPWQILFVKRVVLLKTFGNHWMRLMSVGGG